MPKKLNKLMNNYSSTLTYQKIRSGVHEMRVNDSEK